MSSLRIKLCVTWLVLLLVGSTAALPFDRTPSPSKRSAHVPSIEEPPPANHPFGLESPDPNHPTGQSDYIGDQPKPTRVDDGPSDKHEGVKGKIFVHHFAVPETYCELTFAAKKEYGRKYHFNIYDHALVYEGSDIVAAVDQFGNPQDPDAVCTDKGVCYDEAPVKEKDGMGRMGTAAASHWEVPGAFGALSFNGKKAYGRYFNVSIFDSSLRYKGSDGKEMAAVDARGEVQNPDFVYDDKGWPMGAMEDPTAEPTTQVEMDTWEKMWKLRLYEWRQIGDEGRVVKMEEGKRKMEEWWKAFVKANKDGMEE